MTRLVFITSEASRSRIYRRTVRLPITSRKMHRSLTNSRPPLLLTSISQHRERNGSGRKRGPHRRVAKACTVNVRTTAASFVPSAPPPILRILGVSGRMVHSSLTVSQVPLTRARQNALISSLFVPRHRPQRWTSNVMVTTVGNERKGCRIGPLFRALVKEVTQSCEGR